MLHKDDGSAVTFWLPKSLERRENIAIAFERRAHIFRTAEKLITESNTPVANQVEKSSE